MCYAIKCPVLVSFAVFQGFFSTWYAVHLEKEKKKEGRGKKGREKNKRREKKRKEKKRREKKKRGEKRTFRMIGQSSNH